MILGVDPALRNTGLCLLAGAETRFWTIRHKGDLDGYAAVARTWVYSNVSASGDLFRSPIDVAVVEFPPETYHRGRSGQSATCGYTTGVWGALLGSEIPSVLTVKVSVWRKIILGQTRGAAACKALAKLRANAECAQFGGEMPANSHEQEAYCIAKWWEVIMSDNPLNEVQR